MEKTLAEELKARGYKKLHNTGAGSHKWGKVWTRNKDCFLKVVVLASKKETKATAFDMFEGVELTKANKELLLNGWYIHHSDLRTPETTPEDLESFFKELDLFIDESLNKNNAAYYEDLKNKLIPKEDKQVKEPVVKEIKEPEIPEKENEELTEAIEKAMGKEAK